MKLKSLIALTLAFTTVPKQAFAAEAKLVSPASVPAGFIPDDSKLPEGAVLATEEEVKLVNDGQKKQNESKSKTSLGVPAGLIPSDSPEGRKLSEEFIPATGKELFELGLKYASGEGVEKNLAEAIRWYRSAAELGYPEAQLGLGWLYNVGSGVQIDLVESGKWYRKAADNGNMYAQYQVGLMFANGQGGVEKSLIEAEKWFRSAAEQGYALAQFCLGSIYTNGNGVSKDTAEAFKWYLIAAEQFKLVIINHLQTHNKPYV